MQKDFALSATSVETAKAALNVTMVKPLLTPAGLQEQDSHCWPAEVRLIVNWRRFQAVLHFWRKDLPLVHLQLKQQWLPVLAAGAADADDAWRAEKPGVAACPAADATPAMQISSSHENSEL